MRTIEDECKTNPKLAALLAEYLDRHYAKAQDEVVRAADVNDMMRKQGAARQLLQMRNALAR